MVPHSIDRGFPGGSEVKNLPTIQEPQEMWAQSLDKKDPLEEGTETHSSIPAWRIPWTEESGRLQSIRSQSQMRLNMAWDGIDRGPQWYSAGRWTDVQDPGQLCCMPAMLAKMAGRLGSAGTVP